jgi:multisite-specific tRNA:(cytosine-C5)-methyltransferase
MNPPLLILLRNPSSERLCLNPRFPSSNILVRNPKGDAVRSLYLVNNAVKAVVENNEYTRIRLMAAGTKVFTKQDAGKGTEPQFRVLGEGLPVVLPYIDSSTIIMADLVSLKTLIQSYYPLCSSFPEPFKTIVEARRKMHHQHPFQFMLNSFTSCRKSRRSFPSRGIRRYDVSTHRNLFEVLFKDEYRITNELLLPIWKSNVSLTLMMDKKAKRSRRVY